MGDSLNPTVLSRISRAIKPDFARTALARRIAAGVLVLLAGVAAWRPDPHSTSREVVVATRDLAPGITVTPDDVALSSRPAGTLPDGAVTTLDAAVGATLAGPSRRGEILTDARVLGSRLTGLSVGPNARTVPVHLADAAVLDLIRPGDVVDILGAPPADSTARPRLLAVGAVVVLVSAAAGDGRVVLVALPAAAAHTLAAATLVQAGTLTIH
jgi:Flp pilus assembly protein CpaB